MNWKTLVGRRIVTLEERPASLPADGFVWLDLLHGESEDWQQQVEELTRTSIVPEHVLDARNEQHPPNFDGTGTYDVLILREVVDRSLSDLGTTAVCIFLFDRVVVTFRHESSLVVPKILGWMKSGSLRVPLEPARLVHRLSSAVADSYMALREPLSEQIEQWQALMVADGAPFPDWRSLVTYRGPLRRIGMLCEQHTDALAEWRDDPRISFDDEMAVRLNDVVEHFERVSSHVQHAEADIESLVQLHFAATAHRTNEIMKVLTLVAAVFLPLGLIAGVFGMNFQHMAGMDHPWGYPIALGGMVVTGLILLAVFRRKGWL